MFYFYRILIFDHFDELEKEKVGFVCAETMSKAVKEIEKDYGDVCEIRFLAEAITDAVGECKCIEVDEILNTTKRYEKKEF